jgi:predicted nucleic acid-binding protein
VADWLESVLIEHAASVVLYLPEIVDYEVRRGLLHVALRSGRSTTRSLLRLDRLTETLDYLPLDTATMRRAAGLWAEARATGRPTAPGEALDGDVILASQAIAVGGSVVTENIRHLERFVSAHRWDEVPL